MMKKTVSLFCALTLALALCACSRGAGSADPSIYDGAWTNGADTLVLNSEEQSYVLDRRGRAGTGSFTVTAGRAGIYFNGSIYTLSLGGDGLTLTQNGKSYVSERLGTAVFRPIESAEIALYSLEDMDGTWENEYGESLVIDAENGKYVFNSENGAAEGAAGDEKQGRGPFLSADGRYLYVIMDRDLSGFSLRGAYEDEAPIRGRFARK